MVCMAKPVDGDCGPKSSSRPETQQCSLHDAVAAGLPLSDGLEFAMVAYCKAKDLRMIAVQPQRCHTKVRGGVQATQSGFNFFPRNLNMDFGASRPRLDLWTSAGLTPCCQTRYVQQPQ
jgi:hypothetical protein